MSSETYRVRLERAGSTQTAIFDCAADQPLLLAALAAGAPLPWSCRNGTCRTCISRVVAGTAEHTIPWPGLSAEEKAEGWILPCVACARSDLTLQRG